MAEARLFGRKGLAPSNPRKILMRQIWKCEQLLMMDLSVENKDLVTVLHQDFKRQLAELDADGKRPCC